MCMKQLDSKYCWQFFLKLEVTVLFFLSFIFYYIHTIFLVVELPYIVELSYKGVLILLLPMFFIITFFVFMWARWTYNCFKYEMREEGFRKESGVIWKSYTTIPYSRIQNIDIKRGLLDRIFGLSRILIQTAGSSHPYINAEGGVPGLSVQTAEDLREELIKRVNSYKDDRGGV